MLKCILESLRLQEALEKVVMQHMSNHRKFTLDAASGLGVSDSKDQRGSILF